jgi:flagellar hook-associated protein 2
MALNLSGLASGIDTQSIIDQLMAIERQPRARLQWNQSAVTARQNALKDIDTRLTSLKAAATALRDSSLWTDTQTVDSSDPTKVTGRRLSGAAPGPHTVAVNTLATSEQRFFKYTANAAQTTITVGSKVFTVAANATINDVVSLINGAPDALTYASVDPVSGELRLAAKSTGVTGGFTASGSTLQEKNNEHVTPTDASYTVDGSSYTSSTNVTTAGLPGVELTLRSATTAVTLTVGPAVPDKTALRDKLKAFVDQYNSTVDFINSKLAEKKVASPSTEADAIKGVLYADSTLSSLLRQLRQGVSNVVSNGNPTSLDQLSEVGVTTGAITGAGTVSADAIAGKIVFDTTKFDAAFAADPTSVRRLMGGITGTDGFAQRMEGLIDPMTKSGGLIDLRVSSADSELSDIRNSLTAMDERLANKQALLKKQFTAMESALSAAQAQGSWLTGQIAQLSGTSGAK